MALVDLVMPKMGESIMEATVLKWNKAPGDAVKQDETVLEIATDKVDSEVPSTTDGVLEEVLFKVNDVVPIGSVIARIRTSNGEEVHVSRHDVPVPNHHTYSPDIPERADVHTNKPSVNQARFYSPLVLNIASSEGVALSELEKIPGTGNEGRVTKKDILQWLAEKKPGRTVAGQQVSQPVTAASHPSSYPGAPIPSAHSASYTPSSSAYTPSSAGQATGPDKTKPAQTHAGGNVEILEMDRMRKLVAEHMVRSKHTSPHVTSFSEADVTNLVQWRNKIKKDFEKRENTKITFTPLFIEAIIHCIKKYPLINSSLDGDRIIIKKDINIGMATSLPTGNLIVPVIRNADQLNLVGLSRQVNSLAENARNNRLKPEDTQGGTFTMTNVGTFGSLMGTPIINQPQVAILAVGAIKKRPVVIETPEGDAIAIRHMMYLSLSYDHRIIDGSLGATFLTAVANELESFNPEKEY